MTIGEQGMRLDQVPYNHMAMKLHEGVMPSDVRLTDYQLMGVN